MTGETLSRDYFLKVYSSRILTIKVFEHICERFKRGGVLIAGNGLLRAIIYKQHLMAAVNSL